MIKRALVLLAVLCSLGAHAQQQATPVTGDTRLVTFQYDPDRSYLILTRPKALTHVQLRTDEKILTVGAGDTANFVFTVTANRNSLLIRPKYPDLTTSLTLITTERSYPIIIRSTDPDGGKWHQRVTWIVEEGLIEDLPAAPVVAAAQRVRIGPEANSETAPGLSVDRMNFDYAVEGDAPFRPTQVFDDGRHTFLRLPDALETLPALFAESEGGDAQLLNYTLRNQYLVVQGTNPVLVLKLGKAEIRVKKGTRGSRWLARPWEITGG